jgi:hypothetical protein
VRLKDKIAKLKEEIARLSAINHWRTQFFRTLGVETPAPQH